MASGGHGGVLRDILDASQINVDVVSHEIKAALYSSSLVPNYNTDLSYSGTNEISGTSYSAGGVVLASKTLVASAGVLTFDCNDPQWTSATFATAAQFMRVYDNDVTAPYADPLIVTLDFGGTFSVTSGTFTVQLSASGLWYLTYSAA